jgi:hypothetical protein
MDKGSEMLIERGERYSRQAALPQIGWRGQEKLAAATVVVVGCGGLGLTIWDRASQLAPDSCLAYQASVAGQTALRKLYAKRFTKRFGNAACGILFSRS